MSAFVILCQYHFPDFLPPLAGAPVLAGVAPGLVAVEVLEVVLANAVFAFAIHNYLHPSKLSSTVYGVKIYLDIN